MNNYYTDEKNVQILIALLKHHGVNRVIASPGTTNIAFVKSLQNDPFFDIYSAVDERSAAYMACGMATELGEPVVLSCTGATASRNYFPGLTEAYYRKLPVLAVTSSQISSKIGHLTAQVTDRNSSPPSDVVKASFLMPVIKDENDWQASEIIANKAVLELYRHGGGPVHINLETIYSKRFETRLLPPVKTIERITEHHAFPKLPQGKIGVFIGAHQQMSNEFVQILETFCEATGAVVFCDHTSGYAGKYAVFHTLSSSQRLANYEDMRPDLTIHIGEVSGDYSAEQIIGQEVWRVNPDGEIRDTFGKLTHIFEMDEASFFNYYTLDQQINENYLNLCLARLADLSGRIPELPFSNIWIAQQLHHRIPEQSTIYLAILNSLRSWNFFPLPESVMANSNVGGFGIDGNVSSLIGASFVDPTKLYFGVVGDLAFFYDMNSLGNRHVGNNVRLLLINNGMGMEFKNFNHQAADFGVASDPYIAAKGHFGNKSESLVREYSQSLGFEYLKASNKKEFMQYCERFTTKEQLDHSLVFEVFTNEENESEALKEITAIEISKQAKRRESIKNIIGSKNIDRIKKVLKK